MKLFFGLFMIPIVLFSQINFDKNQKKMGFYDSAKNLYQNNAILLNDSMLKQKNTLIFKNNKLYTSKEQEKYFAYSDQKNVYFNSINYKNKSGLFDSDYFIKSIRFANYYFFEEKFITVQPNGFVSFGGNSGGFFGLDLMMNNSIMVQNMFCLFDIKKEDFYCNEKHFFRKKLKKLYPSEFIKYRKTPKKIENFVESIKNLSSLDSAAIEKMIYETH
jgi:hypothetical protein